MRQAAIPFWSPAEIESSLPDTIAHLQSGQVLAYPTETVYGFGGAVDRDAASGRQEDPPCARSSSPSSRRCPCNVASPVFMAMPLSCLRCSCRARYVAWPSLNGNPLNDARPTLSLRLLPLFTRFVHHILF